MSQTGSVATGSTAQVQLPSTDDIRKLVAVLREDMTGEVRGEGADRLVLLAAQEPHPLAKAGLLERAAKLVLDSDEDRAVMLLRESFRLFPKRDVGELLRDRGLEDPTLARLGRMGRLFDSIAALHDGELARRDSLFGAVAFHLAHGHGRRALSVLDDLDQHGAGDRAEEVPGLRAAAQTAIDERQSKLGDKRKQIVEAAEDGRGSILFEYAKLLIDGDEPLGDASAALADAVEQGAPKADAAPLWAEVARAVGDDEMLARALAAALEATKKPHERLRYADELANVREIDTRNSTLAMLALTTLIEAMPDDLGLRSRWLAGRAAAGDDAAIGELGELRLTAVKLRNREAESTICLALARLAQESGDLDKVERHLRRVRTLDPRNSEALDFFETRYRNAAEHQRLYLVLTHRLAISSGDEVVRIATEMAELAAGPMANDDQAIEAYQRVLLVDPSNSGALSGLEALYQKSERWDGVAELLDQQARALESKATDDSDARDGAVAALERLAAMYREDGKLADANALFDVLQRLHGVAPAHAASEELATQYRRDGRWRHLADVLADRLDSTEDVDAKVAIAAELYDVQRTNLADPSLALGWLTALEAASPNNLVVLRLLEDAVRRGADDAAYVRVLSKIKPLVDGAEQITILEQLSALTEASDNPAAAVALYEELEACKPGHPAARRALTRLYGDVDRHQELVDLLDRRLTEEELDDAEKADLYERLALTAAERLGDLKRAESAANALRKLRPGSQIGNEIHRRAMIGRGEFEELRGLYPDGRAGAEEYVSAIAAIADGREDSVAVVALLSAAAVTEDELADPSTAADLAAMALGAASSGDDAELTGHAARLLMSYAESAENSDFQLVAVGAIIETAEAEERLMYMAQRVAICEDAQDWDSAYAAVTALMAERLQALDVDGMGGAADRVADLAERAAQEEELPLLLCTWADSLLGHYPTSKEKQDDVAVAVVEILRRALDHALVLGVELDDVREQSDHAMKLCSDRDDVLEFAELIATEQGDWQGVIECLRVQAERHEGAERLELLLRAAKRSDTALEDGITSAALYREILAGDAANSEAWSGLLDACRQMDDEAALGQACHDFLAADVQDRPAKAAVTVERVSAQMDAGAPAEAILVTLRPVLATIADEDRLLDAEEGVLAIATGRLELEDGADALAEALLDAVVRHERNDDAMRCFALLAAAAEPGSERHVELLGRWAASAQAADDRDAAVSAWSMLREVQPHNLDSFDSLELLFREGGDFDGVALLLEERLPIEQPEDDLEAAFLRLADIHLSDRNDPQEALTALRRGVAALPKSEAIAAVLLGALRDHGDPADQLVALDQRIAAETDEATRNQLRAEAATLVQGPLGDKSDALKRWSELLDSDPADDTAAEQAFALVTESADSREIAAALAEVYAARGEPKRQDSALSVAALGADDASKLAILRTQIRLRESELNDPKAAFAAASEALRLAPTDDQLFAAAQRLAGDGDEAAKLSLRAARAAAESDPAKRLAALLAHARYATELDLSEQAVGSWQAVLQAGTDDEKREAAANLVEIHDASGDHAAHATALLAQRDLAEDDESAAALTLMAAEQLQLGGETDKAIAELQSAQARDTSNAAVWHALAAALRGANAPVERIAHLSLGWQTTLCDEDDGQARLAALDELLELQADGEIAVQERWETVVAAMTAGLSSDTITVTLLGLGAQADEIEDPSQRCGLLLASATAATDAGDPDSAASFLQALLAVQADHAEGYVQLGALLDAAEAGEDRNDRLLAYFTHGVAHAPDADMRRAALVQLADLHAAERDDPSSAFDVVVAAIRRGDSTEGDLCRLAEAYADQAGVTTALWDVLEAEAEASSDDSDLWMALAMRVVEHEQHHDRARRYAECALQKGADEETVRLVLDAVADANTASDDALLTSLAEQYVDSDPSRAAALLTMRADRATTKKSRISAWTDLSRLASSEAGRSIGLDALAPLRALAMAEPHKVARWSALQAAAGSERLGDVQDAVMASYEAAESGTEALRHDLLKIAAGVAQAAGDLESAAAYVQMALDEEERPKTRAYWYELLSLSGAHEELATELEVQAKVHPDKATALLERALHVWLDEAGNAARGMAVLDQLIAAEPNRTDLTDRRLDVMRLDGHDGYPAALADAVTAARKSGDKKRLAGLLPRAIAVTADQLDAQTLFERLTELGELSASNAALAPFVDVMAAQADELSPHDAKTAFVWLLDNVDQDAEPERYSSARLQQLAATDDEADQLKILDDLVVHATKRLKDQPSAVEWASRALLLDGGNNDRVTQLLDLVADAEDASTALPALQATLELRGDEDKPTVATMQRVIELAPEDEQSQELLIALCDDGTFATEAAERIAPALRKAGQHGVAAQLQKRAIAQLKAEERGPAVLELGTMMVRELGEPEAGIRLMIGSAAALEEPDELLQPAQELAQESGLINEWLSAVEHAVGDGEITGAAAFGVVAQAAAVANDELGDPARAAELWTRIWDADPSSEDARDAVLAMRREADNPERLSVDLERACVRSSDDHDDLSLELATLYHSAMRRSADALTRVRSVLRKDPTNHVAVDLAEQLTEVRSCQADALAELQKAYRTAENWTKLADVLTRLADGQRGRGTVKALEELAEVQTKHLQQPVEALQSLTRAVELAPSAPLLERAVALAREHGSKETPARLFDLALNGKLSRQDRPDVLAAAAEHYQLERDEPERAEALWQQLLKLAPTHDGAYDGLDAIYNTTDRFDELIALKEQRLKHTRGTEREASILHELGALAQATQRNDIAIDAFEQLAKLSPEDPNHLETVVELLRNARNPRKLVELLEKLAGVLTDPSARAKQLTEAAHIWTTRLDDEARGEKLFVAAFELSPGDDEAYRWLERKHTGNPQKLQKLYKHRSTGVEKGPSRTRVLRKLAAVFNDLGRAAQARAVLEKAQKQDPENDAIDEDLLALCAASGDFEGYEKVATRRLAGTLARPERAQLLANLVRMALDQGGDATKWVNQLRDVADDSPELRSLAGLVQADSGDPDVAAKGLESVLLETDSDDEKIRILEKLASLYSDKLNKPTRAITSYQKILKLQPSRADVQQQLADLFQSRGSVEALVETLKNWLQSLAEGPDKVPVMAQLAHAYGELGRPEDARATLDGAYELNRNMLSVNEPLAKLLQAAGELERASELQQWVVNQLRRDREKARLPSAATVAGDMLVAQQDFKKAQRFYRMALQADRGFAPAILGLGRSYAGSNDLTRAMAELEKVAGMSEAQASAADRTAANIELGRAWLASGKGSHARTALNKALQIDPGNKAAVELLNRT